MTKLIQHAQIPPEKTCIIRFIFPVPGSFVYHFLFRNMANMGVNVVVDVSIISIETKIKYLFEVL